MANVQAYFEKFVSRIRLNLEENQMLRGKRDFVIRRIESRLPGIFRSEDLVCPPFWFRNQGSYQMGTGTLPVGRDFDIDLGLYFEMDPDDILPVDMKRLVHGALKGYTKEVLIRRPCITVKYQTLPCHVDIAVYCDGSMSRDGLPRLAMGKNRSGEEFCGWEVSDAMALNSEIFGSYAEDELRQFRRIVRYLKRWKDVSFAAEGNAAPRGIALTVASHEYFTFRCFRDGTPDDLDALTEVVQGMLNSFTVRPLRWWVLGGDSHTVTITLPVEPHTDLCERMSALQVKNFYEELKRLLDALEIAGRGRSAAKACSVLQGVFGGDFPGPAA
ncbi:cyclic GMP-AMP synthase DncV-like nucleotidyltransferase [Longimicrobium terrae]|uniref:Cyclic GMP-AMP synthase n=1 Tax=Longimicrobium terrae TaxID=1639882 RepID=A0A841H1Y3_9BACT|nr:nucleotidyltransferase [Longimicrobium terrae]MBB4637491.1 hypothetical protein [Longimicrobium terrae]MBB6071889.1 hypothetical protein [Longimicrobium terrae]NNC30437.1 nucleotidyltransferase [Longimicrobium terrae]